MKNKKHIFFISYTFIIKIYLLILSILFYLYYLYIIYLLDWFKTCWWY